MKRFQQLWPIVTAFAVSLVQASVADAHGTPIHAVVDNNSNSLVVSEGVADSAGFASMMFVEDDSDGVYLYDQFALPNFGTSVIWELPGYEIFGMEENSGLSLEVLPRPVATPGRLQQRVLWYWNPQTEKVENTPANNPLNIRKSPSSYITLSPTSGTAPPPLQIAAPLASDLGQHKHLVAYGLLNEEENPAPIGAYGFFARLTSNQYGPSNPFLVVLNYGITDFEDMIPAALAINSAAFLPGDYNHDDHVDAADYVVWRKSLNSTTQLAADGSGNQVVDAADFGVWRSNFGLSFTSGAGGVGTGQTVPEPATLALLSVAAFFAAQRGDGISGSAVAAGSSDSIPLVVPSLGHVAIRLVNPAETRCFEHAAATIRGLTLAQTRDTFKDSPLALSCFGATSFARSGGPSLCVGSAVGDFTPLMRQLWAAAKLDRVRLKPDLQLGQFEKLDLPTRRAELVAGRLP